jgi:hypothetical protein
MHCSDFDLKGIPSVEGYQVQVPQQQIEGPKADPSILIERIEVKRPDGD